MSDIGTKPRGQLVIDLLFHALRVNDRAVNAHAAEVFRRSGPELARRLVLEAASRRNTLRHRLRVLGVIERVGRLSGPDDWLDLNVLAADRNPQIRDAAGRCLARHSPALPPTGPDC